jgi:putative FmdB family regulatory protein
MPIYEYRCKDCGTINEFLEFAGKNESNKECKHCGSAKLSKIFSRTYVVSGEKMIASQSGKTCCGREERCDTPPCSAGGVCKR